MSIYSYLEGAADSEPEPAPLAGQSDAGKFLCNAELGIRIVELDKPERNINNRHLHPQLDSYASPEILQAAEL